ncbi:hypothetical protein E3T26_12905 [Cryobacterium sp. TMT1-21]|uniref:hypothetical protein n=1 Tax=unclassified Cryobacterium TaxID=2649013 RepID=UPI00106DBBD5|nr:MULTISPECIES: hypothetical protein [unclassified Cryobacterium]TFD11317.1 hypothetical protein E3T26_12905 [Cryobacterium sp. TMT1-21]TFD17872.1 hypothetical protein E3T42_07000 [Cryobacterium sp. TMT4-10]
MTKDDKHVAYRTHVVSAIEDVRAALVKFSDFVDNAFSLGCTVSESTMKMVRGLVAKYSPLVDSFEERLGRPDIAELIPARGLAEMAAHIASGRITLRNLQAV